MIDLIDGRTRRDVRRATCDVRRRVERWMIERVRDAFDSMRCDDDDGRRRMRDDRREMHACV